MNLSERIKKVLKDENMVGLRTTREIDHITEMIVKEIENCIFGYNQPVGTVPASKESDSKFILVIDLNDNESIRLFDNDPFGVTMSTMPRFGISVSFNIYKKGIIHVTDVGFYNDTGAGLSNKDILSLIMNFLSNDTEFVFMAASCKAYIVSIFGILLFGDSHDIRIKNCSSSNLDDIVVEGISIECETNTKVHRPVVCEPIQMKVISPLTLEDIRERLSTMEMVPVESISIEHVPMFGPKSPIIFDLVDTNRESHEPALFRGGSLTLTKELQEKIRNNTNPVVTTLDKVTVAEPLSGSQLATLNKAMENIDERGTDIDRSPKVETIYNGYITETAVILVSGDEPSYVTDNTKSSKSVIEFKFTIDDGIVTIVPGSMKFFFYGGGPTKCYFTLEMDIVMVLQNITGVHLSRKYGLKTQLVNPKYIDRSKCLQILLDTVNCKHCLYISNIKGGLELKFNTNYTIE
jgi:hypothetical protein